MKPVPTLRTARLLLRQWRDSDSEPFARLNADPRVMEHFPSTLSRARSDSLVEANRVHFAAHGFGLWAVEVVDESPFIGFVGLAVVRFDSHFTPAVEIGWRLAAASWGRGFASEAAAAALRFGFETLELNEIVSLTVPRNQRSRGVMQRLGMQHSAADDFDHPVLDSGHPLRRHVLYRLSRHQWLTRGPGASNA